MWSQPLRRRVQQRCLSTTAHSKRSSSEVVLSTLAALSVTVALVAVPQKRPTENTAATQIHPSSLSLKFQATGDVATTQLHEREGTTPVMEVSEARRGEQEFTLGILSLASSLSFSLTPLQTSVRAVKGGRVTMEDEYVVADGGRFVAVFDGHGGGGVSRYLQKHLYPQVQRQLRHQEWEHEAAPPITQHVAALRQAYALVEDEVLKQDALQYQGSTAVAVWLHQGTLLSANVGDSRAILSRSGQAVDLTRDHKPNDEAEQARILQMGEEIEWDPWAKVHRVRHLSLSRAIGDRYAKPVVSAQVDIRHFPVTDQDEFYLLASDGLWDVMTSQEVVNFVQQKLLIEPDHVEDWEGYQKVLRRNMAKAVTKEALRRGSADNVCVLIVWLNKK